MLLVMCVMVVVTIVAYSTLAAASLQAQSASHARAATQAQAMAESAVSLAMNYLLRPEESPVALVKGASGDYHYPGQANVTVGGESFDVAVSNPRIATYVINATGRSKDGSGATVERKLRVRVVGFGTWKAAGAAQFAQNVTLGAAVKVKGDLVAAGNYSGGGTITGLRRAANYTMNIGNPQWAAPPTLPQQVVPPFASLNLVRAVTENGGKYAYNGQLYSVDYILTNPVTKPPKASASNPGKVFVYAGAAPLAFAGGGHQHFEGTLVVMQADLLIQQRWCFLPEKGMPGLLVAGTTRLSTNNSESRIEHVFYAGKGVTGPGKGTGKDLEVNGVILHGTPAGPMMASDFVGGLEFTYDAKKATVPDLTQQGIRYDRLQVESWEPLN